MREMDVVAVSTEALARAWGGCADVAPAPRRTPKKSPLRGSTKERQWQKVDRIKILKYHESISKINKDLLCKS